jgi:lipopolysaccharide transport system permease protein
LLFLLTARELKLKYQDTVLGFVWSVIKPLLLGLVLYVILSNVARIQTGDIPLQLVILPALFPWSWFQTSTLMATPSIANNGNLIKKVHFPRYVLPFSTVANNMVHFLLTIPIILIFILASGRQPNYTWLIGIPLLTLVELVLLMGVVLFVSAVDVYFRDLEHLVEVFLNLAFYMTPIIYPLSTLGKYQNVALLNPMAVLVEAWRNLFVRNELPSLVDLWPCLAVTAAAVLIGSFVFGRLEKGFADVL